MAAVFNPPANRPLVSSPLAAPGATRTQSRPVLSAHSKRLSLSASPCAPPTHLFPTSRPLRPFPSIANSLSRPANGAQQGRKPTKIIEPPKNFKSEFVLNLTQAELGRQD